MSIFKYRPWWLKKATKEIEVAKTSGREQGKSLVAKLPDIDDRDQAAAWVGAEIWILRSALSKPKRNEYYWCDLEGLEVVTLDGTLLGQVTQLFATGANDVMVVRNEKNEHLVPFVIDRYVREVNLKQGRILVDWDPNF